MEGAIVIRVMSRLVRVLVNGMAYKERVSKESICTDSSWPEEWLKSRTTILNTMEDIEG